MEATLKRLERSLTLFLRSSREHDCILELTGVCPQCESHWDIRDEIEYEIMMEREELAPLWAMQTKQRTAYLCREMVRPLTAPLEDRIVAMAHLVNGQCKTPADL